MDKTQEQDDKTQTPKDETLGGKEPSQTGKETSPKESQTYTTEQIDRMLQLDRMRAGRDWKALETERDNLKSQILTVKSELDDIQAERESLQKEIEDLASGDPDRFSLVKKAKELREQERKIKTDLSALEEDKRTHSERLTRAEAIERDILILEVADGYENVDAEKLSGLCETFGAKTVEQIRKVAETLWGKTEKEDESPPLKTDSGITRGGSVNWRELSPEEKIRYALEHPPKK